MTDLLMQHKLDVVFVIKQKYFTSCQQLQHNIEHNSTFHEVHISLYASQNLDTMILSWM